eukprot:6417533-Pyramimonas_sp.AAC.1
MLKLLRDVAEPADGRRVTKSHVETMEQLTGIKYQPNGLLWDRTLKPHFSVVSHIAEDWMHGCCSSGGIGQYECNAFVIAVIRNSELKRQGLDLAKIDEFQQTIRWPGRGRGLSKEFFRTQVRMGDAGHLACFATETIMAVEVLMFLSVLVLEPQGHLQGQRDCLARLHRMLGILRHGWDK